MYLSIAMSHFNRKAEKRGIYKKKNKLNTRLEEEDSILASLSPK